MNRLNSTGGLVVLVLCALGAVACSDESAVSAGGPERDATTDGLREATTVDRGSTPSDNDEETPTDGGPNTRADALVDGRVPPPFDGGNTRDQWVPSDGSIDTRVDPIDASRPADARPDRAGDAAADARRDAAVRDAPLEPDADTSQALCTQGKSFGADATLADVRAAVASAAPGDVICLARGAVYRGSPGLEFNATDASPSHPIVLCSSDGERCTSSGADNAMLEISSGTAIRITAGVQYVTIQNIDMHSTSTDRNQNGIEFAYGEETPPDHVTVAGGTCSDFGACWLSNPWANTHPPTNISLGTCAQPWFVRRARGGAGGGYGYFQDSVLAMDMADTGNEGILSHNIYFSTGPYADAVSGVVVECSRFTDSGLQGTTSLGLHLKVSGHVSGMIVRNNVFDDDDCNTYTIGVGTSDDGLTEDYASLQIYGNRFRTDCMHDIYCESCYDTHVFNNVFDPYRERQNNAAAFVTFPGGSRLRHGGNRVYNNTFYDEHGGGRSPLIHFDSAQANGNQLYNNLFSIAGDSANLVTANSCDRFGGSGGPDFASNFLHAPSASSPTMLSCPNATGNSTTFSTAPGFANVGDRNFGITASSAVAGKGRSAGAPATDFANRTRPNPPSIGAFDVN